MAVQQDSAKSPTLTGVKSKLKAVREKKELGGDLQKQRLPKKKQPGEQGAKIDLLDGPADHLQKKREKKGRKKKRPGSGNQKGEQGW